MHEHAFDSFTMRWEWEVSLHVYRMLQRQNIKNYIQYLEQLLMFIAYIQLIGTPNSETYA